jgi:hypothetical protein
VFSRPQTQRDSVRMFTQVNGSPFDSVRRRQTPETVLEFPDTEEVTGSNPIRPTQVSGHDDLLGVMAFPLTRFVVEEISCVAKHRHPAWATGCP